MVRDFTLVSDVDLDAYRASLDWYGYAEDDFELVERPEASQQGETKRAHGWVMIHRKRTCVARYYRVGMGLRWTDQFEDDLKRGAFKAR